MSDEQPEPKVTTKISQDEVSRGLLDKLVAAVTDIKDGVHSLRADVGLIANDVSLVKDRVSLVEQRTSALEEAKRINSDRVRKESNSNMDQDAAIAQLTTDVTQLKAESAENLALTKSVVADIGKALKNPLVGKIVVGVLTALATWLASKGVHLQ